MSLINQMLRDLDSQRGPAAGAHVAALQGLGLINVNRVRWKPSWSLLVWILGIIFASAAGYQAFLMWSEGKESTTRPADIPQAAPVKNSSPQGAIGDLADGKETQSAARTEEPEPERNTVESIAPPGTESKQAVNRQHQEPAIKPVKILSPSEKAQRLFNRAQQALAGNRGQQGTRLLQQTLAEYPRHTDARIQLAALLVTEDRAGEAEKLLAQGLRSDPGHQELARHYAQLLAARDALVPALNTLNIAGSHHIETDPESMALRAAILYRMQKYKESANAYQLALDAQPGRAVWWTGLAVSLEYSEQSGKALDAYRRAMEFPLDKAISDYVTQRIQALTETVTDY